MLWGLLSGFSVGGVWVFSSENGFNQKILILSSRNILQKTLLSRAPWRQSQGCQGNLAWRPHLVVEVLLQPGWFIGVTKGFGKLFWQRCLFQCCWERTWNSFLGLLVTQGDKEPLVRKTLHCLSSLTIPSCEPAAPSCSAVGVSHCRTGTWVNQLAHFPEMQVFAMPSVVCCQTVSCGNPSYGSTLCFIKYCFQNKRKYTQNHIKRLVFFWEYIKIGIGT